MAFTVGDFRDLVRLLEERPEWRAELRRLVLSDDLLELPAVVRQLAEHMDQLAVRVDQLTVRVDRLADRVDQLTVRVDQLADRMDQLAVRVDQLADRMDQLAERMDQLAEAQARTEARVGELATAQARTEQRLDELTAAQVRIEQRLDRVESAIERLVEAQGRTETRVGDLDGTMLELKYERLGPVYFSRMARRVRTLDRTRLAELLDDAVDEGRLSLEERDAIMHADAVFRGRRFEDDTEVYVLAEVSVGIGPHDVERASDRAAMLEKLGRPVIAVVGGRRIDAETVALAGERGVWYSLEGRASPPLAS